MRVLVTEDEARMAALLGQALTEAGYEVRVVGSGERAIDALGEDAYDLVLLDVMLPRLDGFATCRRIRERGEKMGILMLTARDDVHDRVRGLDAGADDYLVKPFALEELLARVRALLRRTAAADEQAPLRFDDLELDPVAYTVRRGARALELTRTEFQLLELFLRHPRQVLTRSIIFDRVWGYDFGPASNSLEVYVGYLRRKTEAGGEPRLLHTVRGVGYVLRSP